jgi:hypothetical protein
MNKSSPCLSRGEFVLTLARKQESLWLRLRKLAAGVLHAKSAEWVNKVDRAPGRRVWFNFRETRLTYQKSYLARLNYAHQNAVKHGLVAVANQYPWCSA